jgi:CheY-like chemotaxis protein
MIFYK